VGCVLVIPVYVTSWGTSPSIKIRQELMFRKDRLAKAIWNRGTEVRLKRFLAKAKRGEGFTVGVVGGSGMSLYSNLSFTISTTHLSVDGHLLMRIHHYPPHGGDTSLPTSRWGYIPTHLTTHLTVGIH
jgi:hypothetical protein